MRLIVSFLLAGFVLIMLAGCVTDRQAQDIGNSAQAIFNAAASLPPTPQQTAILANAAAIGAAAGHPLTGVAK